MTSTPNLDEQIAAVREPTAQEIIAAFEEPQEGHQLAQKLERCWPTIKRALLAHDPVTIQQQHERAMAVVEAARELLVGEQPKSRPTVAELKAILQQGECSVRIAPSGEVFVRPSLDKLEAALAALDAAAPKTKE